MTGRIMVALLALALAAGAAHGLTRDQRARLVIEEFSWSPDGRSMLFTGRLPGGRPALYLARANGTEARALTDTARAAGWGSWSPDGRRIAFATRSDSGHSIHTMNLGGTGIRRLTAGAADDRMPSWSPDGSRLAFVSNRDGTQAIWITDPDGASFTRLCDARGGISRPEWSPDGLQLAFHYGSGADTLAVMDADGTDLRLLGPGAWPTWSRDGRTLAFTAAGAGAAPEVWLVNPDGSGRRRLAAPGFYARFSPNGRDVVFLRAGAGPSPPPSFIHSVRPAEPGRERRWPAR